MIKNAARLSLLAIFKESRGDVKNYVVQYGISKHSTNIASLLKCIVFDFQDSVEKEQEDCARSAYFQYQEEIEYIDDVLNLEDDMVVDQFRTIIFERLVVPVLFPLITRENSSSKDTYTLKSTEIGFFLLGKLLQIITDRELKNDIIDVLIPIELRETTTRNLAINNTNIFHTVNKLRHKIIKKIRSIFSARLSYLFMLTTQTFQVIIQFLLSYNDCNRIFLIYTTFFDVLMKHFLPDSSNSEFKKLDLIGSLLETIAKTCVEFNDGPWLDIRSHFARMLQDAGNMLEGSPVVFCSYYKDLTWVKFHKTLVLRKIRIGEEIELGSIG
ncbi:FPL domain-containing protein [Caerostris extrusa]|uniref:FPL domain-containing protein n=1 Tax=Caerostris extrusa TaxID=172846 RepID=A0AAV4PYJ2_CAEEX|nr:FPL domain-containing protein [Caerostris extrusa]